MYCVVQVLCIVQADRLLGIARRYAVVVLGAHDFLACRWSLVLCKQHQDLSDVLEHVVVECIVSRLIVEWVTFLSSVNEQAPDPEAAAVVQAQASARPLQLFASRGRRVRRVGD